MAAMSDYVWSSWTEGTCSTSTGTTMYPDDYDSGATTTCSTDTFWRKSVQGVYTAHDESTGAVTGYIHSDTDKVWVSWVSTSSKRFIYDSEVGDYREETDDDRAARQAEVDRRMIEQQERQTQLKKSKAKAEDTAKKLLLDIIGPKELAVYEETGRLFVAGGKHDYIIQKGQLLQVLEKDKVTDLCVHLKNNYNYPPTDNVIALLVALINDEDMVLNLANWHTPRDRPKILPKYAQAA